MTRTQPGPQNRPMRVGESMTLLAVIAVLGLACFYGLRPWLEQAGWASYPAYLASLSLVFVVMLIWSVAAYLAEGQPRTVKAFLARNRLTSLRRDVVLWGLAVGVFMFMMTAVFSPLLSRVISAGPRLSSSLS